jgi:hypothetical protein
MVGMQASLHTSVADEELHNDRKQPAVLPSQHLINNDDGTTHNSNSCSVNDFGLDDIMFDADDLLKAPLQNSLTGKFETSANDLSFGTFNSENMPGSPMKQQQFVAQMEAVSEYPTVSLVVASQREEQQSPYNDSLSGGSFADDDGSFLEAEAEPTPIVSVTMQQVNYNQDNNSNSQMPTSSQLQMSPQMGFLNNHQPSSSNNNMVQQQGMMQMIPQQMDLQTTQYHAPNTVGMANDNINQMIHNGVGNPMHQFTSAMNTMSPTLANLQEQQFTSGLYANTLMQQNQMQANAVMVQQQLNQQVDHQSMQPQLQNINTGNYQGGSPLQQPRSFNAPSHSHSFTISPRTGKPRFAPQASASMDQLCDMRNIMAQQPPQQQLQQHYGTPSFGTNLGLNATVHGEPFQTTPVSLSSNSIINQGLSQSLHEGKSRNYNSYVSNEYVGDLTPSAANMTPNVMEKLCESMRRSAMTRNLVKQYSGRQLVKQGSARSLLRSNSSSSNAFGHDVPNRGVVRRTSNTTKHHFHGRGGGVHRHNSQQSLNGSSLHGGSSHGVVK